MARTWIDRLRAVPPGRVWVALVLVAVIAFAACAAGAVDCAIAKPAGLAAALGAAVASLFDGGEPADGTADGAPEG